MSHMLEQLLRQAESKTLEFKRDLSSPRNLLKTLIAFANTAGGRVLIGISDHKQVVGVSDPLAAEERICNLIADSISPRLIPNVELVSSGEHTLLILEVFPSNSRPHYLNTLGPDQGVYIRLGSSNRQAGPDLIAEMRRTAMGIVFDEMPMQELSESDVDLIAASRLFGTQHPLDHKTLTTLKLLRQEQGRLVPTHGAILLFGKDRIQHFPDAWIQCARFRGLDKVDIFDQAEIHAHLPEAVTSIEQFLQKHAFKTAQFGAMRRQDIWSIPISILREAIVNALVHSDYSQRGTPIRIAFFDDRIDIESPGLLLPGMTIEDMKNGVSRIRNPVIARIFRELGLIEQWGSGIKRIFSEAQKQGLPEPRITEIATGLRLSIYVQKTAPIMTSSLTNEQVSKQVREQASAYLSDRARIMLRLCSVQPASKAELLSAARLSNAYMNYKRHIIPLVEQGLLELTIPDRPQSPFQRYRSTVLGQHFLGMDMPSLPNETGRQDLPGNQQK